MWITFPGQRSIPWQDLKLSRVSLCLPRPCLSLRLQDRELLLRRKSLSSQKLLCTQSCLEMCSTVQLKPCQSLNKIFTITTSTFWNLSIFLPPIRVQQTSIHHPVLMGEAGKCVSPLQSIFDFHLIFSSEKGEESTGWDVKTKGDFLVWAAIKFYLSNLGEFLEQKTELLPPSASLFHCLALGVDGGEPEESLRSLSFPIMAHYLQVSSTTTHLPSKGLLFS